MSGVADVYETSGRGREQKKKQQKGWEPIH